MPVRVEKRNRLWRIVEPSGKISKTEDGKPRDGGGHFSKEKAGRQAGAINTPKQPKTTRQKVPLGRRG